MFDLYQNYGFPLEITTEILGQIGKSVDVEQFQEEFLKHQDLSRNASIGMFKGGLADNSATVTALSHRYPPPCFSSPNLGFSC